MMITFIMYSLDLYIRTFHSYHELSDTRLRSPYVYSDYSIDDYTYKGQTLKITFQDGSVYEYFGIPKNIYNKFMNSSTILRFARRHIFYAYTYRNVSKQTA